MATHSSMLAWKSPWTEESGGLKSMGLHDQACVHEGGGRWVGSNKVVELKKKIKVDGTCKDGGVKSVHQVRKAWSCLGRWRVGWAPSRESLELRQVLKAVVS